MVINEVRKLLSDIVGKEMGEITSVTTLTRVDGVEPLDVAKLVIVCEKRFSITIHDEDVLSFRCVADLADHIDQSLSDGPQAAHTVTDEERIAWYYEYKR